MAEPYDDWWQGQKSENARKEIFRLICDIKDPNCLITTSSFLELVRIIWEASEDYLYLTDGNANE